VITSIRSIVSALALGALAAAAPAARAQSLPLHRSLNPIAASRSSLALQPYIAFSPSRNRLEVSIEYGNAIEYEVAAGGAPLYLLDAELMRTSVAFTRDLGRRTFAIAQAEVVGSYAGFADGFFAWYHRLIDYRQPEREARPSNQFASQIVLADGTTLVPERAPLSLGDLRGTLGFRHNEEQQTSLSFTLPTAGGPGHLGRGTVSVSAVHTLRKELVRDLVFEGTIGLGATPRHGVLSGYQRTLFMSGSTGIRLRLWGGQSVYGYFYAHSPYYERTGLPSLDRREVTGDFGWISRSADGREWRIGMSEDLEPGDAGIDLTLKVSRTY
jgi:hypothetical protein